MEDIQQNLAESEGKKLVIFKDSPDSSLIYH